MTKIITRVFPDLASAESANNRLQLKGIPRGDRRIIVAGDHAASEMEQARVHETAVAAYGKLLEKGNVVLVVKTTYKPLGAARITREELAKYETVSAGKAVQEHDVAWEADHAPSVMKDHPHFMSMPGVATPGRLSAAFGIPTLKTHKKKKALTSSGKPMSRMFWPMPLLSKKKRSNKVMSGGRHMSRAFWPMSLVSSGKRSKSVIPGGGTPFSNRLGIRTIL